MHAASQTKALTLQADEARTYCFSSQGAVELQRRASLDHARPALASSNAQFGDGGDGGNSGGPCFVDIIDALQTASRYTSSSKSARGYEIAEMCSSLVPHP
jgi:hypothetical protein